MKTIHTQHDIIPKSFVEAPKTGLSWSAFTRAPSGNELRQAKATEQNGLCAYCECRLTDSTGNLPAGVSHLDHFHRQSSSPQLRYDWENLFLSCLKQTHCGIYKDRQGSNIPTSELLHPRKDTPENHLTFVEDATGFGVYACPLPNAIQPQTHNTIKAFNLNDAELVARRSHALNATKHLIDDITAEMELALEAGDHTEFAAIQEEAHRFMQAQNSQSFASTILAYAKSQWHEFLAIN